MTPARAISILALFAFAATLVYTQLAAGAGAGMAAVTGFLSLFAFFVFAVAHSLSLHGLSLTLVLLGLTLGVSLLMESVGVATGLVYGAYSYTDRLGPRFLGLVPLVIPLAWFSMIYCSRSVASLIVGARRSRGLAGIVAFALLCSVAMTAWDLGMDPRAVRVMGMWTWTDGGAWFGVPVQNYVGWLVTTFTIYLLFEFCERGRARPVDGRGHVYAALPGLAYAMMAMSETMAAARMGEPALAMAVAFTMGGLSIAGLSGWLRDRTPAYFPEKRAAEAED